MTPRQAYSQWKRWGADPNHTEEQKIASFAQQFDLGDDDTTELLNTIPEQPKFPGQQESGFVSQLFGAGTDELQKSFGSAIAGPGAELLEDAGWEGGSRFLEDVGTDIVKQQEEDLRQYAAPQTREELIAEGGFFGNLYEHVLPEETQTPQQFARSALPSLGVAAVSSAAGLVTGLATGNPFIGGATAMAVGNALGSFQVGGEEFENAKNDPYIREQLGIAPDADFADLTPDQQRSLTDSAQRVAKDTMVERLYTSGALESLAFIPYGSLALRYVADIGLGATSEELDKRLGMEKTLEELERLGLPREQVPEMREKIAALRPGTFETIWNAAIMEATFGAPTAIVETIVQPDKRVDRRLTAENEKLKLLKERVKKAAADPEKLAKARLQVEQQQIRVVEAREKLEQARIKTAADQQSAVQDETMGGIRQRIAEGRMRTTEAGGAYTIDETSGLADRVQAGVQEDLEVGTETLGGESTQGQTNSRSQRPTEDVWDKVDVEDNIPAGTAITETGGVGGRNLSMDKILHQVTLNELNKVFEQIDFQGAQLVKGGDGRRRLLFEDAEGQLRHDDDVKGVEGFVMDDDIVSKDTGNPIVYLSQSMFNEDGQLITDTKSALDRLSEVAFHESIGHAGLRRMLNAGSIKEDGTWTGQQYNDFIQGFDNRHAKMINRWLEKGTGKYYLKEEVVKKDKDGNPVLDENGKPVKEEQDVTRFRQVEEFIANNFGEKGGGKGLGFFENTAILLRELNPFIGNSLTQYQVAKTIRDVVDQNVKISGKAPKKKNILTGAELVGTIARAATQAKIERDPEVMAEGEIYLEAPEKPTREKEPPLQIPAVTTGQREEEAKLEADRKKEEQAAEDKKMLPIWEKRAKAIQDELQKKEKAITRQKRRTLESNLNRLRSKINQLDKAEAKAAEDKIKADQIAETKKKDTEIRITNTARDLKDQIKDWEVVKARDTGGKIKTKTDAIGEILHEAKVFKESPEVRDKILKGIGKTILGNTDKPEGRIKRREIALQVGKKDKTFLFSDFAEQFSPGIHESVLNERKAALEAKKKTLKKAGKELSGKDASTLATAKLDLKRLKQGKPLVSRSKRGSSETDTTGYEFSSRMDLVAMPLAGRAKSPAYVDDREYQKQRPGTLQPGKKGKAETWELGEMELRMPRDAMSEGNATAGVFYGKDEGAQVWREKSTERMIQDELFDVRPREAKESEKDYEARVGAVKGSPFKVSQALDGALGNLSKQQREIIRLKTQPERITQAEIGEQLGIRQARVTELYNDAINKLHSDPGLQIAAQLQGYATQKSPKEKFVSERDQKQIDQLQKNLKKGMAPAARVETEDLLGEKGVIPGKFLSPRDRAAFLQRFPKLKTGKISKSKRAFKIDKDVRASLEAINRKLVDGTISKDQQTLLINTLIGKPIPFKNLPTLPTIKQMKDALGKKWKNHFVVGDKGRDLEGGQEVSARLDIPAYRDHGAWVPTIHDPKGTVLAYGSTARLKDVQFNHDNLDSYIKSALSVATGEQAKFPFAMYKGKWVQQKPLATKRDAIKALKDPEWTQIGMNPTRHSYFYDRSDGDMNGMPVVSAEEVIQIGGALLAKNVVHGDMNDFTTSTYTPRTRYRTDKKTGKKTPISSKGFQEWKEAGGTAREGRLTFSKRGSPGKWTSILDDFDKLTEEDIKSGRGQMIVYDPNLRNEANAHSNLDKVTVGPKFFEGSKSTQRHVLAHEFSHDLSDAMLADLTAFDLADMGAFGPKHPDGGLIRGINGQFTPGENVAEIGAMITIGEKDDIQFLKKNYPYALQYTTKRMLAEGYPVSDGAIHALKEMDTQQIQPSTPGPRSIFDEPTGTLTFSKRQLPMEVEMRKMQIERLPKGNPHRINALRSLQKVYTLNPVGEKFPAEYAEEISQAKPQVSWSKRLTKERAGKMLEDGKIFTSPELVRQIMGKRPEHINTVMRFLQKQRKRLLNKELTKRDVSKAYAMTVVSQGMAGSSPWKVWDVTGGTRKIPEFVGSGKSKREATLEEWVDGINRQHGREDITVQDAIDWYNKAPIWDTTYEWTGYRNKDGKYNKYQSAMSWETALENGDLKIGKTVLKSKPQIIKNKKGKYVLRADGKDFALNKAQIPMWFRDPGTSTDPDTTTGAFWVDENYTDDRGFVRAEDGMAHWFATKEGQEALDAMEKGAPFETIKNLWRPVLDIRLAMGDDRAGRALFKDLNAEKRKGNKDVWNEAKGGWQQYNFSNLDAYVDKINEAVDRHAGKPVSEKAEGIANDLVESTQLFRNIDVGKEGFIKHMLGMGNSPTIDAIELNVWIAGFPDKSAKTSVLTGKPVAGTVRPELIKWFNDLASTKVPGKDLTYMQLMKKRVKSQFDKVRALDPKAYEDIDPDIFYHVMHHWLWDRAKGLSASSLRGDVGNVQESFRPGVYQAMAPGTEAIVLTERDVKWDKKLEPGETNGTGTFTPAVLKQLNTSKSKRGIPLTDAVLKELQGKKFTRIPTDRFATGLYKPMFADPDHPLNKYMMRGGVGYTLIPENMEHGAMWASDTETINSKLLGEVERGVTHGVIYLMTPDSHLSNRSVMEIYVGETQYMLDKGMLDVDKLEARIQEIVDSTAKRWQDSGSGDERKTVGVKNLLLKAKGETLWDKMKEVALNEANFPQRKDIITHLGGNIMSSGSKTDLENGIKPGHFAGTWDSDFNVEMSKDTASYGAPLSQIYPRITQSPLAETYGVVGISEFQLEFKDADGNTKQAHSKITAEEMGIPPHPAYKYILPGRDVAYWGEANSGVSADEMFAEWLPARKAEARATLESMVTHLGVSENLIEKLGIEGTPGKVKDRVKKTENPAQPYVHKEWGKLEEQIKVKGKKLKKTKREIKGDIDTTAAALNAIRAEKVTQIMRGFGMSGLPVTMEGPEALSTLQKFSQPTPDVTKLYISKSRRRSNAARSIGAVNQNTGWYGRWSGLVQGTISKIEPLSKLKGVSRYLAERQLVFGKMARWEELGAFVYKTLKDSKQSKELYQYLTTEGQSSSIITDPEERKVAEKAKLKIQQIGQGLVNRRLLKKKTLEESLKKHGDYLPRVYLRHLLDDKTRTKIASGATLKPSDLDYLKKRRDIPEGIRKLILGEITTQQGAPAYLASRAIQAPGKDMALMDFMARIKDLSLEQGLNWVIPESVVEFNTLDEAKRIAKGKTGGDSVIRELQMDVDLSGLAQQVTPYWLLQEAKTLRTMAGSMSGVKKEIVMGLAAKMESRGDSTKIEAPDNYKQMPDSPRYGQLRGMIVHKQIANDILGGFKLATGDESTMEKIFGDTGMMGKYNTYWKWAKVAANPPSWARNYVSNNILLNLAGIPMWRLPGLNASAWSDWKNKGKYYQIAVDQGVTKGNMSDAELGRMEKEFADLQNKLKGGDKFSFLGAGKSALQKTYQGASDIYGSLETVGKMMAIKYAMEQKGMNESEAAAFANKWLFDYGLVQPSVRYASTAVVGAPFVRFQSKVIPLMFEVALTKPWRLTPYYAIGYGMAQLFKNNHDIDEEELDAMKQSLAEWLRQKAINGFMPPNVIPLPALDDQGRWQIWDASYVMPWGMMSEFSSELWDGEFTNAMKTLGLMGGPLPDMLAVLKTGVDPFTQRPITDDTKTWGEQAADYFMYTVNMSTPSMFNMEHGVLKRLWDAYSGALDPKTGELKYTKFQANMRLVGMNIYPTDLVEQRKSNIRRMKWEIRNLEAAWTRKRKGMRRSGSTQEEIQEEREEYLGRKKKLREEFRQYKRASVVPDSLRRAS